MGLIMVIKHKVAWSFQCFLDDGGELSQKAHAASMKQVQGTSLVCQVFQDRKMCYDQLYAKLASFLFLIFMYLFRMATWWYGSGAQKLITKLLWTLWISKRHAMLEKGHRRLILALSFFALLSFYCHFDLCIQFLFIVICLFFDSSSSSSHRRSKWSL